VAPIVVPANPKSGPEIAAVEIHNNPIWEPPITVSDPYTGDVIDNIPGRWIQNGTIKITIKNQPFTPYTDKNGNTINVYYCVFVKETTNNQWSTNRPQVVYQSNSAYTIITITYDAQRYDGGGNCHVHVGQDGVEVNFRIQAVIGYYVPEYQITGPYPMYSPPVYEGEGSSYTEFTVTIPAIDNKPSVSKPNITPSTVVPPTSDTSNNPWLTADLFIIVVVIMCVVTIPLVILSYYYGQRKTKNYSNNMSNLQFTEAVR